MKKSEIGSMTTKGGFINEADICEKFLNFKNDNEAQSWLSIMGYNPEKIQTVFAVQIPIRINLKKVIELGVTEDKYKTTIKHKKADVQVRVEIVIDTVLHVENISLKKSNKSAGFNQVDKRSVGSYKGIWNFGEKIEYWLKLFTGEILPKTELTTIGELKKIRDSRRLFFDEMPVDVVQEIKTFLGIIKHWLFLIFYVDEVG